MHPELLNNPTFVRYYEVWQQDPRSLVFAPLADFLCQRKLFAEARKICEAGVRHHPNSVLAHYSLAKTYTYTREWHSARHEAQWVLSKVPDHRGAMEVLQQVEQSQSPARHMVVTPAPLVAAIEAAGGSMSLVSTLDETVSATGDAEGQPSVTGPVTEIDRGISAEPLKKLPWQTVTMAKIYTQQGHYFKARTIYKTILSRTPDNREALAGLADLELRMAERTSK